MPFEAMGEAGTNSSTEVHQRPSLERCPLPLLLGLRLGGSQSHVKLRGVLVCSLIPKRIVGSTSRVLLLVNDSLLSRDVPRVVSGGPIEIEYCVTSLTSVPRELPQDVCTIQCGLREVLLQCRLVFLRIPSAVTEIQF